MNRRFLRPASLVMFGVFLLTSCAARFQRITGFVPTAEPADETVPGTLRVEPVVVEHPRGGWFQPLPQVENLSEYMTQATVDYLEHAGLFAGVGTGATADYTLEGEVSRFVLALRSPTGWTVLAIVGGVATLVGMTALGIYFIAHVGTCGEVAIPGWVWWTMGGGAVAATAGAVGGIASEYLAGELEMKYQLKDAEGRTLLSGSYTGSAEEADKEAYNRVAAAATNDCLAKLVTDLAAALAL